MTQGWRPYVLSRSTLGAETYAPGNKSKIFEWSVPPGVYLIFDAADPYQYIEGTFGDAVFDISVWIENVFGTRHRFWQGTSTQLKIEEHIKSKTFSKYLFTVIAEPGDKIIIEADVPAKFANLTKDDVLLALHCGEAQGAMPHAVVISGISVSGSMTIDSSLPTPSRLLEEKEECLAILVADDDSHLCGRTPKHTEKHKCRTDGCMVEW